MDILWGLFVFCRDYPQTIGAVVGVIVGTLYATWRIKSVIIKQFAIHLGLKQQVLDEVAEIRGLQKIDRERIASLERAHKVGSI